MSGKEKIANDILRYRQDFGRGRLRKRRAASGKAWLENNGATLRITGSGKGERKPVATNQAAGGADHPVSRQNNRRVRFIIGDL